PAPLPAEPQPPVNAEPAAPPPVAAPVPESSATEAPASDLMTNETLPIAGAAALGLLALGGAGLVARRRKRRREDEEFDARQQALAMAAAEPEAKPILELEPADELRPGPVFARGSAPIHDPVPAKTAPAGNVPEGFDLSRFGPHVRAAYRGPTPDNPSVSLEYRLRQAAALDQQERSPAEPVEHP
ncbi:MAG: LPXTG cell wall anchor domain-containing protein, partial [Pseudomonadota bacterium]|nr:LPXTG cell wall anchor domain-containing protein [Pseudomonadota bacterium]